MMTPLGPLPLGRLDSQKPYWTFVPIVQAALSCRASFLSIDWKRDEVCFEWDGQPLAAPEKLIDGANLAPGEIEEFLLTGLCRLWHGTPATLVYECIHREQGVQWKVTPSRATCKSFKGSENRPTHRLKRTRKKRWHDLFSSDSLPDSTAEELNVLRDVCRFAPLQLRINGESYSHLVDLGPSLVHLAIQPPEGVDALALAEPAALSALKATTQLPYSAVLATGGETSDLHPLNLVRHGLLRKIDEPLLASLGLRCVLRCDALEFDQSKQLIKNELYSKVVADLVTRSLVLGQELSTHYAQMNSLERVEAAIYIRHYAELQRQRGEWRLAEQWLRRLLEAQLSRADSQPTEAAETLCRLGNLHLERHNYPAARNAFQESLELAGPARSDSMAMVGLAEVELAQANFKNAQEYATGVLSERRGRLDAFDRRIADACALVARVYRASSGLSQEQLREIDQLYLERLRILEHNHGHQHLEVAEGVLQLADHRREQFRYKDCESLLKRALQIRQQVLGDEHPGVAETLDLLGDLYEEQGRPGAAGKAFSQALAIWESQQGPHHPLVQERLRKLAILYRVHGKFGLAEPLYRRILLQPGPTASDPLESAQGHTDVALLLLAQGNHDQAEQALLRALELWKLVSSAQGNYAWTLDRLGDLLTERGRHQEALSRLGLARKIWLRVLGKGHPDLCVNLELQARAWIGLQEWSQAERFLRRALELKERFLGPNHRVCIRLLGSLAEVLRRGPKRQQAMQIHRQIRLRRLRGATSRHQPPADRLCGRYGLADVPAWSYLTRVGQSGLKGRFKELRPLCLAALCAREKALGPAHADVAYLLDDLANLYRSHNRPEAALGLYQRTLQMRRSWLGPMHPEVCLSLRPLVELHTQRRRWDLAQTACQDLLRILEANLGDTHPELATTLQSQAEIYRAVGSDERAEDCLRRAAEMEGRALKTQEASLAFHLAELSALEENPVLAAQFYERGVALVVERSGPGCPRLASVYGDYAVVLRKLDREALAVELETEREILQALRTG